MSPSALPLGYQFGGAIQRRIIELGIEQGRMGNEVLLLSPDARGVRALSTGADVVGVGCRLSRPWRDLEMLGRGRGLLRSFGPDVIHFHGGAIGGVRVVQARHVLTVDYPGLRGSERALARGVYQTLLRRFDAITTVSKFCRDAFEAHWPGVRRPWVVPNGVNLQQFRSDPEGAGRYRHRLCIGARAPVVLYVGRVCRQKGSDTLAEAVVPIRRAIPGAQVLVAGPPEQFGQGGTSELIQRIVGAGGRYLGAVDEGDLASLYSMASVFVMPTREHEMFGMAVVEAQACGTAVACSQQGGLPEVADGGACFFPPGDASALASTVISLLKDKERQRKLVEAGRTNALRYLWQRVAEEFAEVYEQCGVGA